jgi:hypothetical protein
MTHRSREDGPNEVMVLESGILAFYPHSLVFLPLSHVEIQLGLIAT